MSSAGIPEDAARQLAAIENKYDIFFKVNNGQLTDYFNIDPYPTVTLSLKENKKVPFTLIDELKRYFHLTGE